MIKRQCFYGLLLAHELSRLVDGVATFASHLIEESGEVFMFLPHRLVYELIDSGMLGRSPGTKSHSEYERTR
jgi:hypothetical protein